MPCLRIWEGPQSPALCLGIDGHDGRSLCSRPSRLHGGFADHGGLTPFVMRSMVEQSPDKCHRPWAAKPERAPNARTPAEVRSRRGSLFAPHGRLITCGVSMSGQDFLKFLAMFLESSLTLPVTSMAFSGASPSRMSASHTSPLRASWRTSLILTSSSMPFAVR